MNRIIETQNVFHSSGLLTTRSPLVANIHLPHRVVPQIAFLRIGSFGRATPRVRLASFVLAADGFALQRRRELAGEADTRLGDLTRYIVDVSSYESEPVGTAVRLVGGAERDKRPRFKVPRKHTGASIQFRRPERCTELSSIPAPANIVSRGLSIEFLKLCIR